MLEYTKALLRKVSFDKFLFIKELKKGLKRLTGKEREELKEWSISQFSPNYRNAIFDVFKQIA